jgi:hypothetical protein
MGKASGCDLQRSTADYQRVRNRGNAGSFDQNRANLDAGAGTRFKQTVADPSVGDRFGQLTVMGCERVKQGAAWVRYARVQCSCGAEPHLVYLHNLLKGASTRCNVCAKKSAGFWRKDFYKYADACPNDDHRRRLLNRLSACKNRCHNPKDRSYSNYGGRGIYLYEPWRTDKAAFLRYVVTLEGWDQPHLELDRIDVNKGYEPGNLRFVTRQVNRYNQRKVQDMQRYILELEARVRHLEQRLAQSVHHPN